MIDTCTYPTILTYESHGEKRLIALPTSCTTADEVAQMFVCMMGCMGFAPGHVEGFLMDFLDEKGIEQRQARHNASYDASFPFAMKVWLGYDRGCTTLWWGEELEDEDVIPCLNAHFGSFDKFEWCGPGIPIEDAWAFAEWVSANYSRIVSPKGAYFLAKDNSTATPFDVEDLHRIFHLRED